MPGAASRQPLRAGAVGEWLSGARGGGSERQGGQRHAGGGKGRVNFLYSDVVYHLLAACAGVVIGIGRSAPLEGWATP